MLKKISGLSLLFTLTLAISAWANTIWIPTESGEIDINYVWGEDVTFAIFDDSADPNNPGADRLIIHDPSPISLPGLTIYADTIEFTPSGSDWLLQSTETGNSLTLTDSYQFQIALFDGGSWIDPSYNKIAEGQYALVWSQDITVLQVDAKPVPVPAAILLLGAGAVSLVGWRFKK